MKKRIALVVAVLMLSMLLFGCGGQADTTPTTTVPQAEQNTPPTTSQTNETTPTIDPTVGAKISVGAIQGPTGIGMVQLMDKASAGATVNEYTFTVGSSPQEISAKLAQGALDIAALPTNVAATLYNKTSGKVKLLAVNTLGVLYILENGDTVQSMEDLRGKTIYSTGEGANPEYILKYVLQQSGLDPEKDVKIEFLTENTELATRMASGEIQLAMVPEPQVSSIMAQNTNVRVALSMNNVWESVAGENSKLMMGCVAVRDEFLQANKAAVDAFLTEYAASIATTTDVETTAALCETYGIIPKAAIAKKAIPNCQITFVKGAEMKAQIGNYYDVLFTANPASIGGAVPTDAFYYEG